MNKKFIFIIFLFIILLIFAGILLYIFKFKNNEIDTQTINTREFLIKAKDVTTNKLVITNFTIISNGTQIYQGITNIDGYEKINIPIQYSILEIYPQNSLYYTDANVRLGNSGEIELRPIGNISVVHIGKLNSTNGDIRVYVDTDYENREISFCLSWSQSIIKVENDIYQETMLLNTKEDCVRNNKNWIEEERSCSFWCKLGMSDEVVINSHCDVNYTKTLPPSFFKQRVDKCYYSQKTITKDNPLIFDLKYIAYNTISERDFIKLYIFDSNKDLSNKYQFESVNKEDWALKTLEYEIK